MEFLFLAVSFFAQQHWTLVWYTAERSLKNGQTRKSRRIELKNDWDRK